jgi:hypothetical protein
VLHQHLQPAPAAAAQGNTTQQGVTSAPRR